MAASKERTAACKRFAKRDSPMARYLCHKRVDFDTSILIYTGHNFQRGFVPKRRVESIYDAQYFYAY